MWSPFCIASALLKSVSVVHISSFRTALDDSQPFPCIEAVTLLRRCSGKSQKTLGLQSTSPQTPLNGKIDKGITSGLPATQGGTGVRCVLGPEAPRRSSCSMSDPQQGPSCADRLEHSRGLRPESPQGALVGRSGER